MSNTNEVEKVEHSTRTQGIDFKNSEAEPLTNQDIEDKEKYIGNDVNYNNNNNENNLNHLNNNNNNHVDNNYSTINNTNASIKINLETSTFDLYKGLFYMFISCVFKSLFSILSKVSLQSKKDLSSFQLLTFRTYFMLWINLSVILFYPINVFSQEFLPKNKILPMLLRTVFAIISMSLVIFTLKQLHISDVYAVYYLYPGMVMLFSFMFLKEKSGFFDFVCLFACFIGALFIVKPDFIFHSHVGNKKASDHRLIMFSLVLGAAILKAIEDVIVRDAGKEVNFLVIPFLYGTLGIILFPIPMIISDVHYPSFTFMEVVTVFLIAVCTFAYQAFMALGLQNENAGRVSLVNYFQVAFMYISDITIFRREFHSLDFIGTMMIFGFNMVNGYLKCTKRYKEMERLKQGDKVAVFEERR